MELADGDSGSRRGAAAQIDWLQARETAREDARRRARSGRRHRARARASELPIAIAATLDPPAAAAAPGAPPAPARHERAAALRKVPRALGARVADKPPALLTAPAARSDAEVVTAAAPSPFWLARSARAGAGGARSRSATTAGVDVVVGVMFQVIVAARYIHTNMQHRIL